MNNLTTEQLARIFGERIGQDVKFTNQIFTHTFELKGVRIGDEDVLLNDNVNDEMYASFCKLLLTPLEKISDEDAIKFVLADGITGFSKFDIIRKEDEIIIKWWSSTFAERSIKFFNKHWLAESIKQPQLVTLKNLGYDVPMFFGIGHSDNGKTLIELGVAIDKTTLNK